jgi:hypothetical protein
VRIEALRRAEIGERVTHATVKAVVDEYRKTGDTSGCTTRIGRMHG